MSAEKPKILLVEDEPTIALLEREALERSGLQVEEVALGARAVERLRDCGRIAMMVLDYRLPDMNGGEVLAALGDRLKKLPVVVVTGYPDPEIEDRLRAAGIYDFLVKDTALDFLQQLPRVAHEAISSAA